MNRRELQELQTIVLLTSQGKAREQKLYWLEEAKNSQGEERQHCFRQYEDIRDNGARV